MFSSDNAVVKKCLVKNIRGPLTREFPLKNFFLDDLCHIYASAAALPLLRALGRVIFFVIRGGCAMQCVLPLKTLFYYPLLQPRRHGPRAPNAE